MNPLLSLNNPESMGPQHSFSGVPEAQIQRSTLNRSHSIKTTLSGGFLVPFMADEVYPGDTFNMRQLAAVLRLVTPITPFMDNLYADWFFFFVPFRQLWDNFRKFMGEQDSPADSTSFLMPALDTSNSTGIAILDHSPYDYMGIPPGLKTYNTTKPFSAMYGRAFNRIYQKWFRDQNLQTGLTLQTGDGPDIVTQYQQYGVNNERLPRRGKRHDQFTSCLPWPQKINDGTTVSMPLGTSAVVKYVPGATNSSPMYVRRADTDALAGGVDFLKTRAGGEFNWAGVPGTNYILDPNTRLYADLSTATAASINQTRLAITLQQLFERDARGGSYLPEIIRSHFGVTAPNMEMQWPEYIGGGETPIQIHAIPQTSATGLTGGSTPAGNLTAVAAGHEYGKISWTKSFVEHGILMGILSIRADLTYQQGVRKQFLRTTRYSMYWPTFANIGEQAVQNMEIYFQGHAGAGADTNTFGYQEAWYELRYYPNEITGGMRSTATPTFDIWHLAQKFTALPTLGAAFIEDTPPINRVIAASSTYDQFYADIWVDMHCTRPLPLYSVPGLDRL